MISSKKMLLCLCSGLRQLFKVVKDVQKRKSFGAEVAEIAAELNIPKTTVEAVLRTRYRRQIEAIKRGESVTVEGLFSIKVFKQTGTGELTLRGGVSPALREAVRDGNKKLRMLQT